MQNAPIVTIDRYSMAALPITMYFGETKLSTGTAFFWERDAVCFLVSNWHNFSGRNPQTGAHLSPTAAEPDRLSVALNLAGEIGPKQIAPLPLRGDAGRP